MVVINRNRHIALAVRRDKRGVVLVPMSSGHLSAEHLTDKEFAAEWQEYAYPLAKALGRFLTHMARHGATKEAREGLERLRDNPAALCERLV